MAAFVHFGILGGGGLAVIHGRRANINGAFRREVWQSAMKRYSFGDPHQQHS